MNKSGWALVTLVTLLTVPKAWAVCVFPPNPAVFCGVGTSAIRGDVVAPEEIDPPLPAVVRVVVTAIAGEPLEGVTIGAQLEIVDGSEFEDGFVSVEGGIPVGDAVFVLKDANTFVLGAPVDSNDRVQIAQHGTGGATLPADYVLQLAVDADQARCRDVAFEVVEPPVPRISSGQCNDETGCGAAASGSWFSIAALALALKQRRR